MERYIIIDFEELNGNIDRNVKILLNMMEEENVYLVCEKKFYKEALQEALEDYDFFHFYSHYYSENSDFEEFYKSLEIINKELKTFCLDKDKLHKLKDTTYLYKIKKEKVKDIELVFGYNINVFSEKSIFGYNRLYKDNDKDFKIKLKDYLEEIKEYCAMKNVIIEHERDFKESEKIDKLKECAEYISSFNF
jgi:hypothetical protein